MIADILTVAWKELKEMVFLRANIRGGLFGLMIFIGVFGIMMPLQVGRDWVETPIALVYWAWLPFLLVSGVVADSFAGERERHTLETLLASRLSDRAIYLGKFAASVGYGWGLTMVSVILSLITINAAFARGQLILYEPVVALGILALTLLVAGLSAAIGVLVSLRAATVRQAQQTLSIAFYIIFVPAFLLPMAVQYLPKEWVARVSQAFLNADLPTIIFAAIAGLLILDGLLISAGMARFRRAQLILD